jgi:hypothetical protein
MAQKNEPENIPKKNRPYDKTHGFHSNQEGLFDINHDDVSSPPVTGEGYNTQHGDDGLSVNRKDQGTGSSERYSQSGSRRDKGLPPDAEINRDKGQTRGPSRH